MSATDSFPRRLTRVDPLTLDDHHYLSASDFCLFLGEYTARRGYDFSPTNHLIINYKKPMERKGKPEWKFKLRSIRLAAEALCFALRGSDLSELAFVPVPPSKRRDDDAYDDRVERTLALFSSCLQRSGKPEPLILDVVRQAHSTCAAHDGEDRPTPAQLASNYLIDRDLSDAPQKLVIFDDMLTTGAHFCAMRDVLSQHVPDDTEFRGLFLARRAPETNPFERFLNS